MAMRRVTEELPEPIGDEFKTTFDQINLGVIFADAMAEMVERVSSSDLNFWVIALRIQRKTGGNLTELLTSLSKTIRERIKLKGKVWVLAAEGKLSDILIGAGHSRWVAFCLRSTRFRGRLGGIRKLAEP
jgi:tight adherence protein B